MNTEFSDENQQMLGALTRDIQSSFGDAVFCPPVASLHITLLDWIAPLVDYEGQDKDQLFAEIQPGYDAVLTEIISSVAPIKVHFNELHLCPSTIYMVGHDNGAIQAIRDQFMSRVTLLSGAKRRLRTFIVPLARFTKVTEMEPVKKFVDSKGVNFDEQVTSFRLTHVTREPLLEFEVLKLYQLRG